jgi:signal transduction histidine kinase
VYQNEAVGELYLAPRAPGDSFTAADERLLRDLARHAGVAAHAVQLTAELQRANADLQRSRARLVTTREEERRRLRRDLHDGLGATLTGLTFGLDTASNLLTHNPDAVRDLLHDLKTQAQTAIADIRHLVYDLRPPALDELGLAGALQEQVSHYQLDGVQLRLESPERLPVLPAAVEVAAYRIALEALANVVRHAHARSCTIRLALSGDALAVEVQDDGVGLPPGCHAGVGMRAMRERAAELGGSVTAEPTPTGGTCICARLPLVLE